MTFVVTDACIGVADLSCIESCPVDCIYTVGEDPEDLSLPLMVVIDPEECIDCGVCVDECPVEAITRDALVHGEEAEFLTLGAMHVGRGSNSGPDEESRMAKADIAEAALALHAKVSTT